MHHGKRPFPSDDQSEEKEDQQDPIFPIYSARSQQDISAIVSALSRVIGNNADHQHQSDPLLDQHMHGNPSLITTPPPHAADHTQSHSLQDDQGMVIST